MGGIPKDVVGLLEKGETKKVNESHVKGGGGDESRANPGHCPWYFNKHRPHPTLQTYRPGSQVLRVSFSPPPPPAAQLSCLPHLFQVVIDRGYLRRLGYSSWDVHLNDELCRPQVRGRYLIFSIPYGRCGTVQQVRRRQGGGTLLQMEAKGRGFKIQPPAKNLGGKRGKPQAVTLLETE